MKFSIKLTRLPFKNVTGLHRNRKFANIIQNLPFLTLIFVVSSSSSSAAAAIQRRNELFTNEQQKQRNNIGRIEKIEIRYLGLPDDTTLVMNKNQSTPYNCAQHLSEGHCKRSALALLDGKIPWDMHRPIIDSCTLQLLNFTSADPHIVNKY